MNEEVLFTTPSSKSRPHWEHFRFCSRVCFEIKTMNVSCMFKSPSTKYFVLRHLEKCHTTFFFLAEQILQYIIIDFCLTLFIVITYDSFSFCMRYVHSIPTLPFVIRTKRRAREAHAAVLHPSEPHKISKSLQSSLHMTACYYEP